MNTKADMAARAGYEDSYIVLRASGNTYFGSLATKFAYNGRREELEARFDLSKFISHPLGQFWVVEVTDEELIVRAAQSTWKAAQRYMAAGRMCVWHEALENVVDERERACRIAN